MPTQYEVTWVASRPSQRTAVLRENGESKCGMKHKIMFDESQNYHLKQACYVGIVMASSLKERCVTRWNLKEHVMKSEE